MYATELDATVALVDLFLWLVIYVELFLAKSLCL